MAITLQIVAPKTNVRILVRMLPKSISLSSHSLLFTPDGPRWSTLPIFFFSFGRQHPLHWIRKWGKLSGQVQPICGMQNSFPAIAAMLQRIRIWQQILELEDTWTRLRRIVSCGFHFWTLHAFRPPEKPCKWRSDLSRSQRNPCCFQRIKWPLPLRLKAFKKDGTVEVF